MKTKTQMQDTLRALAIGPVLKGLLADVIEHLPDNAEPTVPHSELRRMAAQRDAVTERFETLEGDLRAEQGRSEDLEAQLATSDRLLREALAKAQNPDAPFAPRETSYSPAHVTDAEVRAFSPEPPASKIPAPVAGQSRITMRIERPDGGSDTYTGLTTGTFVMRVVYREPDEDEDPALWWVANRTQRPRPPKRVEMAWVPVPVDGVVYDVVSVRPTEKE